MNTQLPDQPSPPAANALAEGGRDARPPASTAPPAESREPGAPWGPGIVEVRPVTERIFGIRVARHLVAKLKTVRGLTQATPRSDLFCLELPAAERTPDAALNRFKEMAADAGLGIHFGAAAPRRGTGPAR
ncbi:MAG: hypothetical protein HY748_10555 [Elusimicrobia bacterium]|nr:hypothetical protein [Elusimicrobiota bacterium]